VSGQWPDSRPTWGIFCILCLSLNTTFSPILLKGTVARDFPPPFFHQNYLPWTLIHTLIFFSNLLSNSWSYFNWSLSNLAAASCSRESYLPAAFCSGEMWFPAASCSGESDLTAAFGVKSYRSKMQWGVKSYLRMMEPRVNLAAMSQGL
jgi:hypothetical protein